MIVQIISNLFHILYSKKELAFLILGLVFSAILFFGITSFKLAVFISIIFLLLFYGLTQNMLASLYVLILLSGQFLWIGKYYEFELASSYEYVYESLNSGIIERYGLGLSDLFAFGLLIYFLRKFAGHLLQKEKENRFLVSTFSKLIFMSWIVFFVVSFYSSYYDSFFPTFSLYVLLQYSKMLVVFLGGLILLRGDVINKMFFHLSVLSVLIFQSFLGMVQFLLVMSGLGSSQQYNFSFVIPEEATLILPRVEGSFLHANDYSFVILKLLLVSLIPILIKKKFPAWLTIIPLAMILMAQSRTIWLIVILIGIFFLIEFKKEIKNLFFKNFTLDKLFLIRSLLVLIIILGVIAPRVSLSHLFFDQEGGGALRIKMLEEGLFVILQKPLFGYGIESNVRVMLDNVPDGYIQDFPFSIHNMYFRMAIESGIIGAFFFFLPFYLVLRKYFHLKAILSLNDKLQFFLIAACSLSSLTYYLFQPSNGRLDYIYLTPFFAIGVYLVEKYEKIRH